MLYINYPTWIHPQILPEVPILSLIRWYGLMYIVAFCLAFCVLKKLLKEGSLGQNETEDDIFSCMTWGIVFLLIGARIFSTLVYDTSRIYLKNPLLIFWPFDSTGHFTGLAGMSYHGGFVGGTVGLILWCKVHKKSFLLYSDAMVTAIPLGYTFGRLGNFLNGELFGRITTMPWGMIFPRGGNFPLSIDWVKEFALKAGMKITNETFVNLPRHPSQIYEALFEGLFLWLLLYLTRKKRPFKGFAVSLYAVGYGIVRFIIEYFREPDVDLGFRIAKDKASPIFMNTSLLNISTGQILCFLMIIFGIIYGIFCFRYNCRNLSQKK